MKPRLQLLAGGASGVTVPPVESAGTCLESRNATGDGLTTFRYVLPSGQSVVVTVPAALAGDAVRAAMWGLFDVAEACGG